jgi:hypothetical protein
MMLKRLAMTKGSGGRGRSYFRDATRSRAHCARAAHIRHRRRRFGLSHAERTSMFTMPDANQLSELAAFLKLQLTKSEAELYLPVIYDAMRDLDKFVQ